MNNRSTQELILGHIFNKSIDRENLLSKKYKIYIDKLKDKSLIDMIREFESETEEHTKKLKDAMNKLNIDE